MAVVRPEKLATPVFDDQLYRLIAETIPHIVWTASPDGTTDYQNRRLSEYTGLDAAQLEGWGWKSVVHPEDWERCLAAWTRALQSGERYEIELRLRRADGAYRWHRASAVPLRTADGRVFRWFGTSTDIEAKVRDAQLLESIVEERTRALHDTQARLRALIDNEPECVKVLDAQGHLVEMNAAGLRMIEADRAEDMLGRCVYAVIAPDHVGAFRDLTERVCRGERGTLEFELVGLRGTHRWMETHAVPFRDEASGETRLLAITRDITDRRRAEQALRESERRFQLFMDHLPAIAWIHDSRLRYVYTNKLYEKVFGFPSTELLGQEPARFFSAPVAARFLETNLKVQREGATIQYAIDLPRGRWLAVKFPFPDSSGGIGVAGVALDITEQSRLEEALRESEQRFRAFMDHAPARAWIKDARFRYTYVNRAFESHHGRPANDVLGRDDFELFPADMARYFRSDDEEVLKCRGAVQELRQLPYGEDRVAHWLLVKFPLADASGATGVAGIAIDVTARVEAEEKARRYAEDVRNLVNRLVQTQEAERRRVADELHDLIGQNLTALGIDLQALKQRLQAGGDPGGDRVAGPRLDAMAMLLDTTIDAIRGVMTDLRPAALEEFGLVPALRWYASQFGKRTGMKISTHSEGRKLRLPHETELGLFRIAQEALTNAAKHSGGTAVKIAVLCGDARLRLTVEDDGRGFEAPVGARRARRGGFGLPTMRERAEALGGSLRVEFPDRGTRLVVEIPLEGLPLQDHAD